MRSLEQLDFEVYEVDTKKVVYKQKQGYERIYIEIDFSRETINFWAVFEDSYNRVIIDVGVPISVIEASIEILKDRKVVIDYALQDNRAYFLNCRSQLNNFDSSFFILLIVISKTCITYTIYSIVVLKTYC